MGGGRIPRPAPAPGSRSPDGNRGEFEFGVVKTVRDSFGFIRLLSRNGPDLFFHASEVLERNGIDDLRVNDEVKFVVREAVPGAGPRDKDGKANALMVRRLSEEDRRPVVVDEGLVGKVVRGLRGRTKMDSYGGRISFMHPQNEPGDDDKPVIDDDEFPALGGGPAPPAPAKKDPEPSTEAPRERSIEFEGADLDDSCPRLKVGDTVVFDVIENRFDGRRRPDRIRLSRRQTDDDNDAKKKEHSKGGSSSYAVTDAEGRHARSHREAHPVVRFHPQGWREARGDQVRGRVRRQEAPEPVLPLHQPGSTNPRGRPAGGRRRLVPRR